MLKKTVLKKTVEAVARSLAYIRESSGDTVLNLKPYLQFDSYSCGMQSLAAVLNYYDYEVKYDELEEALGLTEQEGCDENALRKVLRLYGLKHRTFHRMSLASLHSCIDREHPVLISVNNGDHWSVLYGYGDDVEYVMDPVPSRAFTFAGKRSLTEFKTHWDRWGIEVFETPRKRVRPSTRTPKRPRRKTG